MAIPQQGCDIPDAVVSAFQILVREGKPDGTEGITERNGCVFQPSAESSGGIPHCFCDRGQAGGSTGQIQGQNGCQLCVQVS